MKLSFILILWNTGSPLIIMPCVSFQTLTVSSGTIPNHRHNSFLDNSQATYGLELTLTFMMMTI